LDETYFLAFRDSATQLQKLLAVGLDVFLGLQGLRNSMSEAACRWLRRVFLAFCPQVERVASELAMEYDGNPDDDALESRMIAQEEARTEVSLRFCS
jgi:hypothetical protein